MRVTGDAYSGRGFETSLLSVDGPSAKTLNERRRELQSRAKLLQLSLIETRCGTLSKLRAHLNTVSP